MLHPLQQRLGLWRSLIIYHGIPFRKRRLIQFYSQFIEPGALCFDIGSHVGNRLSAWNALGAQIVAFEPQPLFMQYLRSRFGDSPNIILRQEAVGASPGSATLYISTRTPTVTSLSSSWIQEVQQDGSFSSVKWDRQVEVLVATLDQLISEYGTPTLCKIDVEGFELQVLQGLSTPIPLISFEYIPAALGLAQNCISEMGRIGNYRFNWSTGENYRMQSNVWISSEEMIDVLSHDLIHGRSGDIYARLIP